MTLPSSITSMTFPTVMDMPRLGVRRFLLCHHSTYAEEYPQLFGDTEGEGVLFRSGTVVVEINEQTFIYTSLDELVKTFASSGILALTWLDKEEEKKGQKIEMANGSRISFSPSDNTREPLKWSTPYDPVSWD